MKKQDLLIVGILFALLLAWPYLVGKLFPSAPTKPEKAALAPQAVSNRPLESGKSPPAESTSTPVIVNVPETPATPTPSKPERRLVIANNEATVTVSSWGGGIVAVELNNYRRSVARDSGPMVLDFSDFPALAYAGLPGFSSKDNFNIEHGTGTSLRISKSTPKGLHLTRILTFGTDYRLKIADTFQNKSQQAIILHDHELQIGPMRMAGKTRSMRLNYLGVDALPASGGEGVTYWAGKLIKLFKRDMKERGLSGAPEYISKKVNLPVDWVAAKSKFFVQIMAPDGGASGYRVRAVRVLAPGERKDPSLAPKKAEIASASATVQFSEKTLAPGESLTHVIHYYVGPKKYSILKKLGLHQDEVMDFGWWKPVCKFLLMVLNFTYNLVPNYGVAIILLTILIRIIFWPLTHKSTESMKRMQELQPLMKDIRAKYKDSPKKMQEETMGLYRKHKVNPMSGCLPMIIQIPVFVALFVVLRSAIELRFAPFLWIHDLSEPERLLAGVLPIPLNILPIFMAVTMAWQQKLMPTTDLNQQKIMLLFMPAMMLVMFYNMPSALVLYWSTNQCIMIAQMLIQKKRTAMKAVRSKQ